ncbi:cellulase family protein [Talaromyces proteolyticus]|uniref:Cellulase family protein n=1 Tax=Talaromyces proteolyticus TaxID=1131652 RepID=A0AAD4L3I7_9EURO|nr:cellulase family protein [Talaromyces proteolyticus]KAH8705248.1 cellulase family protein [Talaromyces proteolyticus]
MHFNQIALTALAVLPTAIGELHTSSRWILDSNNQRVKLRCVNWAGHMEAHVPEGLNKQSIDTIAGWIADNGFNCVRLTYSIDMALDPTQAVSDSFAAAGTEWGIESNMTDAYNAAVVKNPFLSNASTVDVYSSIIDNLASKGVMTILDNHVSKASWCCNLTDGNGWWDTASGYNGWNSRFFNTSNWLAGLEAMATFALEHPGVVAMSIRNELRPTPLLQDLTHDDWYNYVTQGALAVHKANPHVLIIIGGSQSATDMSFIRNRSLDFSQWARKHVWEFHSYSFTVTFPGNGDCTVANTEYGALDGFVLTQNQSYTAPLILSEFGVGLTGGPNSGLSDKDNAYLQCLVKYMESNDAEWAVWAVQGSYYVRDGIVDYDESYGLLNHDWSDWRNGNFSGMLGQMWNVTQGP